MKWANLIAAALLVIPITRAWDGTELTNRAIVVSSSLDKEDSGQYRIGYQVVLPGGLSPKEIPRPEEWSTFFVVDGMGDSILDAAQSAQTRLSRQYFLGHRKNIFFGESLAKDGLTKVMDEFTRNPNTRLRTDLFIVQGGDAEPILHVSSPLEHLPGMAALKSRQNVGAIPGQSLLEFLMAASSRTSCPTIPAIVVTKDSETGDHDIVQFAGRAIFDKKLRLRGYIDFDESVYRLWVLGTLTRHVFTTSIPGYPGKVSFESTRFKTKLRPSIVRGTVKMNIDLYSYGSLNELNVPLDLGKSKNISLIEKTFESTYTKCESDLIRKFQESYQLDAIGYDKAIERAYPREWKKMMKDWPDIFPTVKTEVHTHFIIRHTGSTTSPIHNGLWW